MADTSKAEVIREACALADELDLIRSAYGEECVTFVKKALFTASVPDWQTIIMDVINAWHREHPHALDMNL